MVLGGSWPNFICTGESDAFIQTSNDSSDYVCYSTHSKIFVSQVIQFVRSRIFYRLIWGYFVFTLKAQTMRNCARGYFSQLAFQAQDSVGKSAWTIDPTNNIFWIFMCFSTIDIMKAFTLIFKFYERKKSLKLPMTHTWQMWAKPVAPLAGCLITDSNDCTFTIFSLRFRDCSGQKLARNDDSNFLLYIPSIFGHLNSTSESCWFGFANKMHQANDQTKNLVCILHSVFS